MTRPPDPGRDLEDRRNARIRAVRQERSVPAGGRRRMQPVVLLGWFAGVIALLGILIFLAFLAFAPRLMAWVEDHPGSIENGIVLDFVKWHDPGALADTAVSDDGRRITVVVPDGFNDDQIGQLLFDSGLVNSRLAFQYAVLQAGREGTLQAGDVRPVTFPAALGDRCRAPPGVRVRGRDHHPGGLAP